MEYLRRLSVLLLLMFTVLSGAKALSVYQPECAAWDSTVTQIRQSLSTIRGSATCTKSPDCTGLSCDLYFWGKRLTIDVKLYPCDIPAQMRLRVRSSTGNINFEQSVTHGDSYNLPGFQYSPFSLMPSFKMAVVLVVHFKKVASGLQVGLRLETRGLGSSLGWPLMPDTTVPTPPCPTGMPSQCVKMDQLLSNMEAPPGFLCSSIPDCDGFSCIGEIGFHGFLTYDINSTLVVNSCDSPISYTVSLISQKALLNYNHKFTHSDSVTVTSSGMPRGSTANLTVIMNPSFNLDSIDTSIKVDICIPSTIFFGSTNPCYSAPLLTRQPVPIPPCESPLPSAGPPQPALSQPQSTGRDAECNAWGDIERGLMNTPIPNYGFDTCRTNANCMGLTCQAVYDLNTYTLYMELLHCAHPVTLMLKVDSPDTNFHYAQNVTQNSTYTVNEKLSISIKMFPVTNGVLLGGSITSTAVGGFPLTLPVITDRVVPTPPCNSVTSSPGAAPTVNPIKPGVHSKTDGNKPNSFGKITHHDNDGEPPKEHPLKQRGINLTIVGVAVGFAALFTILVLVTIYYFSQRHRRPRRPDEVILVGNTESSRA